MISGHAGFALDRRPEDLLLRRSLEAIHRSANEGALLTRRLLRIGGVYETQPEWIDLNKKLGNMRDSLGSLLGDSIALEMDLTEDLGELLADSRQLDEMLIILMENARDAMPAGGMVRVETSAIEMGETYTDRRSP